MTEKDILCIVYGRNTQYNTESMILRLKNYSSVKVSIQNIDDNRVICKSLGWDDASTPLCVFKSGNTVLGTLLGIKTDKELTEFISSLITN